MTEIFYGITQKRQKKGMHRVLKVMMVCHIINVRADLSETYDFVAHYINISSVLLPYKLLIIKKDIFSEEKGFFLSFWKYLLGKKLVFCFVRNRLFW